MAVDNRPFKSKEQDGQGNEVIIRDQQLVEQGTATTMASGACFETRDVDDRPVKIPRDNMMNIVLECIGIILNDSSRNLGTNVQKALGLQGNTVGHSTVADFASVLGGVMGYKMFEKACVTNDVINVGTWSSLIIVGHSQGAARALYFLKGHVASTVETIADGGISDIIQFVNPTTYELGIKYTGSIQDTIRVTALYVR